MARKCLIEKSTQKGKFEVREYNRCPICGRSRGYYRKLKMCRVCLRKYASAGLIPGMTKSSW